ncbi:hypothetical protein BV20DRAFT_963118 [Pilatotrama ljubarskyi]|nr:hypothetical protein BV20DRAFT_963118 [Pilatotrama ljubarskyi]
MLITFDLINSLGLLIFIAPTLAKHGKGEEDADGDDDAAISPTTPGLSSTTFESAPASSSIPPSSSTSSAPVPSITPHIQFLPPGNATECQSLALRWQSADISAPITLMITNDRAVGAAAGGLSDDILITRTVATNVSASTSEYSWSPVDVLRGAYVAVAYDTSRALGILAESPPFFVLPGQDTSCLTAAVGSLATPAASLFPPSTSSSTIVSSDAATPSATPSPDSQPKTLSPGALGGTIAGISVAVILFVLACSFPHYWRSYLARRPRNSRPGGPYYLF